MIKISEITNLRLFNFDWPDSHPISDNFFALGTTQRYTIYVITKEKNHKLLFIIPKGFLHDKRSTPRFLWFTRPRDGRSELAALIHDMLYRTAGFTKNMDLRGVCDCEGEEVVFTTRLACDQIYKFVYQQSAPEKFQEAEKDFFWLRIFGGKHFGRRFPPGFKIK